MIGTETRLQAVLDESTGSKVLDVGCYGDRTAFGHPKWLHGHLIDVATNVTGIDVNQAGVEELRAAGYDVYHADAENFKLNTTFDVIVAAEVIEHLANPGAFLDRARDHLIPGGKLVLTTPNLHSLFVLGAYLLPGYRESEHTIGFTPELLGNLLTRCGWQIQEMSLTSHEDIPKRGTRFVNALVPNALAFTIFCVATPPEGEVE